MKKDQIKTLKEELKAQANENNKLLTLTESAVSFLKILAELNVNIEEQNPHQIRERWHPVRLTGEERHFEALKNCNINNETENDVFDLLENLKKDIVPIYVPAKVM